MNEIEESEQHAKNKHDGNYRAPIVPYVAPLIAFLLIGMLAGKFETDLDENSTSLPSVGMSERPDNPTSYDESHVWTEAEDYTLVIALQCLVVGVLLFHWRKYYQLKLPWKISWWGPAVGIVGAFVWIGLCHLGKNFDMLAYLGMASVGERSSFNPFESIYFQWHIIAFLVLRFSILVLLVPIAEELLLRGFLMRFIQDPDFESVKFSQLTLWPLVVGTLYGVLSHPGEAIAAAVWFSMVSWLMLRTGKFWDCVIAHAITNALLGAYVISFEQWQLW